MPTAKEGGGLKEKENKNMNKLFTKIAAFSVGLAMAIGVGVAVGSSGAKEARAATESVTFSSLYSADTDINGTSINIGSSATVTFNKASGSTAPKYYKSGTAVRAYAKNTFVVASSSTISKITITYGTGGNTNEITANTGTWDSPNWTGSANSVTFTIGGTSGNRRISGIEVTTGSATTEATGISFSPSSVTVNGGVGGSFTPTLTGGSGNYEKTITWSSSNTTILPNPSSSEDGDVVNFTTTNPQSDTTVTLTASVVSPGKANIGSISITVKHVAEHTITYDANGGTGTMSDSINIVSANGFTAPTGMEFKEWNTQADGEGTTYAVGANVTADTDLYAIWQRLRYTTGFESSDGFTATQTYNTTKVDGPTGKQWQFVNGTAASGNVITGGQSAQLRKYNSTTGNPNINMQFNIDEIHSISFNAKSGSASMGVEVFYSTNNGSSWTSIGTETVGTSVVAVEKEISSYVASGRFKIEFTGTNPGSGSNKWMSIDDIVVETQSATPTVTSVTLSPADDVTLKVGNSEVYTVTITGTNLTGSETATIAYEEVVLESDAVSLSTTSVTSGGTVTVTAVTADGAGELSATSGGVKSNVVNIYTEAAKTLSSISVDPESTGSTDYFTGDTFSKTGFIINANYTDSTSSDVSATATFELMRSGSPVSISTPLVTTDTTVRVSYTESGTTKTVDITIEVIDDYVEDLSWGSRGTVDCFEGTTLGNAVNTSSWTFTATWASGAVTYPTFGTGSGQVHIGLYSTSSPESESTALSTSYQFTKNDDGKYIVAYFGGAFTAANTNKKISITDLLNAINVNVPASFAVADSIEIGDTVYLASTVRELSGISTGNTKYGLATAFSGSPAKLYPLTVAQGSEANSYAFANSDGSYLSVTNGNTLNVNATLSTSTSFTVSFDNDGNATITSLAYTTRSIQYNATSTQERFANYLNNNQTAVQLWKNVPAGTKNIANTNFDVQKVVVGFAKTMNSIMNDTNVCSGDYSQRSTAWGLVADEYDNLFGAESSLNEPQLALAKQMFANCDATNGWEEESNRDVLQQAMKTYDVCVKTHKLNPFMDGVRSVGRGTPVNPLAEALGDNAATTTAIVVASVVSAIAVGGYFFIRRRKVQ